MPTMTTFLWAGAVLVSALVAAVVARRLSHGASRLVAAAVALTTGIWAALLVQPETVPAFALLAAAWGAGTAVDLTEHRLPDLVTLAPVPLFFLLLIPAVALSGPARLWTAMGGAVLTAVILFVLAYINPSGFGLGDVKLGLTTGAALGWLGLGVALLGIAAAFILMAVISGILLATKRISRDSEIAFGPFMVLGVLVAPFAAGLLGW